MAVGNAAVAALGLWLINRCRAKFVRAFLNVYLILVLLNAPNLPGWWHLKMLGFPLARHLLRSLARKVGIPERPQKIGAGSNAITSRAAGQSPFAAKSVLEARALLAHSDFNLHMSNSTFPLRVDYAGVRWIEDWAMNLVLNERLNIIVNGQSFNYLRAIPLFCKYTLEIRIGSWTDACTWFYARFLRKPSPSEKIKDGDTVVKTKQGEDLLLCAMGIKKAVARFTGAKRQNEKPPRFGRVLGACGFGPMENWDRVARLEKEGKLREWMVDPDPAASDGLERDEEKRKKALELIHGLEAGGKSSWLELDRLLCADEEQ